MIMIPRKTERLSHFLARALEMPEAEFLDDLAVQALACSRWRAAHSEKAQGIDFDGRQEPLIVKGNDIYLYGDIGNWPDEVGFDALVRSVDQIAERSEPINVRVNSRGGMVDEGFVMANYLQRLPNEVNITVDAFAGSIASYIAMVGQSRFISPQGKVMIHNPQAGVYGEASDMRKQADILDDLAADIRAAYMLATGWDQDKAQGLMDAESWFNAQQSVDEGLMEGIYSDREAPEELPESRVSVQSKDDSDLAGATAVLDDILDFLVDRV